MPQDAKIFRHQIYPNVPIVFMAQVESLVNGAVFAAADVASATYDVFDMDGAGLSVPIASGIVVINQAFHALKKDRRWKLDNIGFNFDHTIPGNVFTLPARNYQLRYSFTAVGDANTTAVLPFQLYTLNI